MQRVVIGLTCGTKLNATMSDDALIKVMRAIAAPAADKPSGGMWIKTSQGQPCVVVYDQITHAVYV